MSDRKKVYVETTVVSDATALPARDIVQLGRQVVTREWWATASLRFDLYSSMVVAQEVRKGDPEAAKRRVEALSGIPELDVSQTELGDVISQAFGVTPKENEVFLPKVMSRKKQIIPSLSALWG